MSLQFPLRLGKLYGRSLYALTHTAGGPPPPADGMTDPLQ
jgi:hypothetical protein